MTTMRRLVGSRRAATVPGMKISLRAPFGLGVVLLLSACEIGPVAVPPVESPATPVAVEQVAATPAPSISGAAQNASTQYGLVSQYLGASDARPDGRGLTDTRKLPPTQCGLGCVPTPGKRPLDAARDKLINDTVKNVKGGGTSVINITGSVDNRQKTITASDSRKLAANRAEDTARTIAREVREDLKDAGVKNPNVRAVAAGSPEAATCGTGTRTCVVYQAHPLVLSSCKSPANGGCQLDLGRHARASAVHNSNSRDGFGGGDDGSGDDGGSTTTTVAGGSITVNGTPTGGSSTGGTPNPGAGVFGPFPPLSAGGSSTGSSTGSSSGSSAGGADPVPAGGDDDVPAFDDSYFTLYPEDRFDIDALSVRIVLDVPRTFRVGGTLTEQEISVKDVVVYCGSVPCTSPGAPSVASLAGRLSLASSSSAYRLCATERSSNCSYYLTTGSAPSVGLSGSEVTGGRIEVGFRSPTGSGVRVLPTLVVDEIGVFVFEPAWVGGTGCDADLPPKSCWEWEPVFERDMTAALSVITASGEILVKGPSGYRLERQVYGTVGSG